MGQITFVYKKTRFPNMQCDYYENYYSFSFFLQKKSIETFLSIDILLQIYFKDHFFATACETIYMRN